MLVKIVRVVELIRKLTLNNSFKSCLIYKDAAKTLIQYLLKIEKELAAYKSEESGDRDMDSDDAQHDIDPIRARLLLEIRMSILRTFYLLCDD